MDLDTLLSSLAARRPIFHSEADFQHELAWQIHLALPAAKIRLERPTGAGPGSQHIDLSVETGEELAWIELKFIPRQLPAALSVEGEVFSPKSGAGGRAGFVRDLARLEALVDSSAGAADEVHGFAVLLTSYPPYWKAVKKAVAADVDVYEGKILYGPGGAVALAGSYEAHWSDYSKVSGGPYGQFRYLACEVQPEEARTVESNSLEAMIITACALRFKGYEYADDHGLARPSQFGRDFGAPIDDYLARPDALLSREHRQMLLCLMQRRWMHDWIPSWTSYEEREIRRLFLELCAEEVPAAYSNMDFCPQWDQDYRPRLPDLKRFVRLRDRSANYTRSLSDPVAPVSS